MRKTEVVVATLSWSFAFLETYRNSTHSSHSGRLCGPAGAGKCFADFAGASITKDERCQEHQASVRHAPVPGNLLSETVAHDAMSTRSGHWQSQWHTTKRWHTGETRHKDSFEIWWGSTKRGPTMIIAAVGGAALRLSHPTLSTTCHLTERSRAGP